jgi:hypothetical protein
MKLSEYKNEDALLKLADLLEPISKIATGDAIKKLRGSGASKLKVAQELLRSNPKEIIEVMAILDDVPVDEYEVNIVTLPVKLVELMNDPEIMSLFKLQGQSSEKTSSGSATENTEA